MSGGMEVRALPVRDPLAHPLFQRELTERYLIFDACVGGARRVDLHPLVLSAALHQAAVDAALGACRLIDQAARWAHEDEAERARYGLHPDVLRLAAASRRAGDGARLARVDLLLREDGGFQACEINADCPGGHNETLALPALAQAAGFWEGVDPTSVVPQLVERLAQLAGGEGPRPPGAVGLLYATAYAEDLQVCALLRRALLQRGVPAILCPPTAPRLQGGRLCVKGQPLAVLYRYFPIEYMEGQRNLSDITAAVASGAVRALSSFAEIFAQSKLAFARISSLADRLSAAERDQAARWLPESWDLLDLDEARLVSERRELVVKRALGRVGDEVFVGALCEAEAWAELVTKARAARREGEAWIAQRFIRQRPIPTPLGPRLCTLGAYVLDGRFVGYFARLSEDSHVSHDALCVPVFVAR